MKRPRQPQHGGGVSFQLENLDALQAVEGEAGYLHQLVPVQLQDLELGHPLEHSLGEGGDPVSVQSQLLYIHKYR